MFSLLILRELQLHFGLINFFSKLLSLPKKCKFEAYQSLALCFGLGPVATHFLILLPHDSVLSHSRIAYFHHLPHPHLISIPSPFSKVVPHHSLIVTSISPFPFSSPLVYEQLFRIQRSNLLKYGLCLMIRLLL